MASACWLFVMDNQVYLALPFCRQQFDRFGHSVENRVVGFPFLASLNKDGSSPLNLLSLGIALSGFGEVID